MTNYKLELHDSSGRKGCVPYTATGPQEAIDVASWLLRFAPPYSQAEISGQDGRIIMTLPGNDKLGKETTTASKWQQLSLEL